MKMIDVLVKLSNGEVGNGATIKLIDDYGEMVNYEYAEDLNGFYDGYSNELGENFDINPEFLNKDVELTLQKEKKYLIKLNVSGMDKCYLNLDTTLWEISIQGYQEDERFKTQFTEDEMSTIEQVKNFLQDMEGKYELIEVK